MAVSAAATLQRPDLGVTIEEYRLEALSRSLIADQALPLFEVALQSAEFGVIPVETGLRVPDTNRAPGAAYPRGDWQFETDYYACSEHGWEEVVDDSRAAIYRRFFDAEQATARKAAKVFYTAREYRASALLFNTTTWSVADTEKQTVSVEWDTSATAVPRAEILKARKQIHAVTGLEPNALIVTWSTYHDLLNCASILDALKYTAPLEVSPEVARRRILATVLGVDRILVGGAIYNSALEGATPTLVPVWDDEYAMLACVCEENADLEIPAVGRTFLFTGDSPDLVVVESYRLEERRSDVIRLRQHVHEKVLRKDVAILFDNITT